MSISDAIKWISDLLSQANLEQENPQDDQTNGNEKRKKRSVEMVIFSKSLYTWKHRNISAVLRAK